MNYKDKYIKYKKKYFILKNMIINNQIGGNYIKIVKYENNNICTLNNIDKEILDEFSEYPIASITKIFTIISLLLLHQNNQVNIYDNITPFSLKNGTLRTIKK